MADLPAQERAKVLDNAIERYGAGESVYAIANDLGIEHTTLYRHLVKEREDQWRDAKVSKALVEVEDAEQALKDAADMLALSRARERLRAAQWQLERLLRRIYGQEAPEASHGRISITLNVGVAEEPRRVIDMDEKDHNP